MEMFLPHKEAVAAGRSGILHFAEFFSQANQVASISEDLVRNIEVSTVLKASIQKSGDAL
jgi:hypothetical protein